MQYSSEQSCKLIETKQNQKSNIDLKLLLNPVTIIPGIGTKFAEKLAKLSIYTVIDLLFHIPYKYQDRTKITNINDLKPDNYAVVQGEVVDLKINFTRTKKRVLNIYLADISGILELKFFHFNNAQLEQFKLNPSLRAFGEVKYGKQSLCMFHPEYKIIDNLFIKKSQELTENLTAIYPSTEGISQKKWEDIINKVFLYLNKIQNLNQYDYLPKEIKQEYNLEDFFTSINLVHKPTPDLQVDKLEQKLYGFQFRLIFEELLAHQLAMLTLKKYKTKYASPILDNIQYNDKLIKLLPFKLTIAQQRVYQEIAQDLASSTPMVRLVQGDVGSGKTIIAALAMLQAVSNGYQTALMAPTEILAEQHFNNLNYYFKLLNIKAELLVSKLNNKDKINIKNNLGNNNIQIIIGTHALIQEDVIFNKLGLIIIDEQHRFGVEQRNSLFKKSLSSNMQAHQLTMTATPIPRTLAMTIYADMSYSVIDELPPGRKPIQTIAVSDSKKLDIISRIKNICAQGRQVYWVCTLIEESESLQYKAAQDTYQEISDYIKEYKIGLIHGRLNIEQKNQIMADFKANKINILVATTVIEVGVDVPNANLMVIENPERLGLAQLHQLRGRVGRGEYNSFCVLLYSNPISNTAQQRLDIMRKTQDGFKLAEFDLKTRGSGELLGKKQTGVWQLKIADLLRDKQELAKTQKVASYIIENYPELTLKIMKLWLGDNYKLGKI